MGYQWGLVTAQDEGMEEEGSPTALSSSGVRNGLAFTKLRRTSFALASKRPQQVLRLSGGDALRGNTRTHPEHDG